MGPFAQADDHPFRCDLDHARRVDKLPEQPRRPRPGEALQPSGSAPVQEISQDRQVQDEVHVQPDRAAQAIEREGRDLFTKGVLHVIPTGGGLDGFACRLRLREVVGPDERRRLVPQSRHDQLPQVAVGAVEPDPLVDVSDLAALPLGSGDRAVLPALRGQASHAPTGPTRDGGL